MSLVRSPRSLAAAGAGLVLGTTLAISLAAPASADVLPTLPQLPLPTAGQPTSGGQPTAGQPTAGQPTSSLPELLPVTCTVTVSTPTTLSVGSARPSVPMKLTRSGCDLTLISSGTDVTLTGGNVGTTYTFADVSKPTSKVVPAVAGIFSSNNGHAGFYNTNNINLTVKWKYSRTVAKYQTRSAMSTVRKGRTIIFGGFVKHYTGGATNSWAGTSGRVVYLEKLTSRGWEPIRTVRSHSNGGVAASYTTSKAGYYRWRTDETGATWRTASTARRI